MSLADAIRFADLLPALIRALFVVHRDPEEPRRDFASQGELIDKVREPRRLHDFSPGGAIAHVARALWRNVEKVTLADVLKTYRLVRRVLARRASGDSEWRALGAAQSAPETPEGRLGRW